MTDHQDFSREVLDVTQLKARLRVFAAEREWERFHTPKNLAMALAAEVGELLELFQWLTAEESSRTAESDEEKRLVSDELADLLIYIVRLADVLGIDVVAAIDAKLVENAERYSIDLARGSAIKHASRRGSNP